MKKQKMVYQLYRYAGAVIEAKREVPFELKLSAQLMLDEICFSWNKQQLESAINHAIDTGDKEKFGQLCEEYRNYIWE
ncbi:IDEAL domain-containing protein [Lentibacillus sp. CBA3610]|uniref:IDEAL domain-containing protein n=1 Tax=Lentibacillus sp. CBA3610 TaxID=2518176 RepID=UPI0015963E01|nr:IDEAL domain-containing protein [Lentibacillus sp. CBA3610]QKY68492.1 IDEAL domain-containing protein [Lentibacillus sp. CBA3610]